MIYREISLATDRDHAEALSDLFEEHGAVAITLKDAADQPIYSSALEELPLWDHIIICALFNGDEDLQAVQNALADHPYQITEIPEQNWEETWKADFHPQCYAERLWIYPSWEIPENPAKHSVILDPGLAFGTGKHATTHLCLQWLAENIQNQKLIIDYGCGSGILAIAALKLGAQQAIAIDIDPQAINATRENAKQNAIENLVITDSAEQLPNQAADIVIANILANPLIELALTLANLVKAHGKIILSGILTSQTEKIIATYAPWFEFAPVSQHEEWAMLIGQKRSN